MSDQSFEEVSGGRGPQSAAAPGNEQHSATGSPPTPGRIDHSAKPLVALTCDDVAAEFQSRMARSGKSWR